MQVKALACELPAQSGVPLSRYSGRELAREVVQRGIVASISGSTLLTVLVGLQRFDEALAIVPQALALAPGDLGATQYATIAHVGKGDISGAHAIIRDAIGPTSATELVAYFAGYNEMAWLLEDKEYHLLFRLSPAAFDNDRAWWGQSLAIAASQRGEVVRARAYADSSLAISAAQSTANPRDPQLHALYGVVLALVGRNADSIREAEQAVSLAPSNMNDQNSLYARLQLGARVHHHRDEGQGDCRPGGALDGALRHIAGASAT